MTSNQTNTAPYPFWPGPRLLVPMTLDILMIGTPNQQGDWADVSVSYTNVQAGGAGTQGPFATASPPSTGAHLIWTLPYALRHGQQKESGELEFPLVPDRWVIMRSYTPTLGQPPTLSALVLQSDYLGATLQQNSQYPDPSNPATIKKLGQAVELSNWQNPPAPATPFLRAIGPGQVTWSVIYNNVENVFAFHDDLSDEAMGWYTYMVCGWYAAPGNDPLFGQSSAKPNGWTTQDEWQALMNQFKWSVGDAQDLLNAQNQWHAWQAAHGMSGGNIEPEQLNLPALMICHAMVFNVQWQGKGHFYDIGVPGGGSNFPTVAVGNTGAEALSAWMAKYLNDQSAERLLDAFQIDQIFEFSNDVVGFETSLHATDFGSKYGGREWVVVRPEDDPNGKDNPPTPGSQTIPLTPEQTQYLTNLNNLQAQADDLQQSLNSMKWELFATYWKSGHLSPFSPAPLKRQVNDTMTSLMTQIPALNTQLAGLQSSITAAQTLLVNAVKPDSFIVTFIDAPHFWKPADPVVLVAGSDWDTKLTAPGDFNDDDLLFTRFTGQNINSLSISFTIGSATKTEVIAAADLTAAGINLPTGGLLPAEMNDLWIEALLLDQQQARLLATIFFKKANITDYTQQQLDDLTATVAKQQTLIWNNSPNLDRQTIAELAGLQGTIPSKLSVEAYQPPWTPIYMDWRVEWHPTSDNPAQALKNWTLGEIDYEWTGTTVSPTAISYQGRTVFNAQTALNLSAKINQFLSTNPNIDIYQKQELQKVANDLGTFDVLIQGMAGFHDLLLMRESAMNQAIANPTVASLVGNNQTYVTRPGKAGTTQPYYPIRSGHLKITDLWIVDAYGQILRAAPSGSAILPIRAESLVTAGDSYFLQLAPRYSQSAKLDFNLLDADSDSVRSNSSDLTSSICGWILPNHLDSSLMVFDALGNNQGSVLMVENDQGTGLRWETMPGTDAPLGGPPTLQNQHLQGFVQGLLQAGMQAGAQGNRPLVDLLNLIDSTLGTDDPLGQQQEGNLSVLLGRPLAIVRADISMELMGQPDYDQSWEQTGKAETRGFTNTPFPVRIGDAGFITNGVMGYFVNDDYLHFSPVYGSSDATSGLRQALASGSQQLRKTLALFAQGGAASVADVDATSDDPYIVKDPLVYLPADGKTKKLLTIILDPRGTIPAISGLFPVSTLVLPPGPTTEALNRMEATFRVGPVLTDPNTVRMPLPAEIKGNWSWIQRTGVAVWSGDQPIGAESAVATIPAEPLRLNEGWLKLSGALRKVK